MSDKQRRLKAIEVSLTPEEIVNLWAKKAQSLGDFADFRQLRPEPRACIANQVYEVITTATKGFPESTRQRAIQEARETADTLYNLAIDVNIAVIENRGHRDQCYALIVGYLLALSDKRTAVDRVNELRSLLIRVIEDVLILDEAIKLITSTRFNGQELLFADTSETMKEQLRTVEKLCQCFNEIARQAEIAAVDLERVRASLEQRVSKQARVWVRQAFLETVAALRPGGDWMSIAEQILEEVGDRGDDGAYTPGAGREQ